MDKNYWNNKLKTLELFKKGNFWYFSDNYLNIQNELFIDSASRFIDYQLKHSDIQDKTKCTVIVSDEYFPGVDVIVTRVDKKTPDTGTWYSYKEDDENVIEFWLCSVLLMFYEKPPLKIYIKFQS